MSRIPKFGSKQAIGTSQTTDEVPEIPLMRKVIRNNMRRSKSFSDMRSSNSDKFLPPATKATGSRMNLQRKANNIGSEVQKKGEKTVPVNVDEVSELPVIKKGVRSDKTNILKNSRKANLTESVATMSNNKRKGENVDSAVQPKMVRKVPDWDYKTKWGILNEKHKNLVQEHKSCQTLVSAHQETAQKYQDLLLEVDQLKQEKQHFLSHIANLESLNMSLGNRIENLEKNLNEADNKITSIEAIKNALESKYQQVNFNMDCIKKEYAICEANSERIAKKLESTLAEKDYWKNEFQRVEQSRRELHNEVQDIKGNIRIFCRVRPAISEQETCYHCRFEFPSEKKIEIAKSMGSPGGPMRGGELQEFTFDKVFDQVATQEEVFEELSHLIQSAIDGYHICVFAYGQTGSGKTYTMQGEQGPEKNGMIPRSIKLIFEKKQQMEAKGWVVRIQASFLEIYNENVRDLLNLNSEKPLTICFNKGKGTTVSNLTILPFETAEELTSCMFKALQNRSTAETTANEHSSRSHAVSKIYIEARCEELKAVFLGSVSLVDLAGSESAKSVMNSRLAETKNINKSLSCLGNVLLALHKKESHIPYRNSKLTFLLQSSLGGNCKCLMIVNISPHQQNFSETINTLRFAAKVKEVKTECSRNKVMNAA